MPTLMLLAGLLTAPQPAQCLSDAERRSFVYLHPRGSDLTAVIAPTRGGQLVGLQLDRAGRSSELLYRGMNFCPVQGFDGKAPILWPATGRNYATEPVAGGAEAAFGWTWQGQRYPMPIHGFAKDSVWRVVSTHRAGTTDSVTLQLADSTASRKFYPFAFAFTITYRLRGNQLSIDHKVVAGRNSGPMPFSIGNHITFAIPLGGRGDASETTVSTTPGARILLDSFGRPERRVSQLPLREVGLSTMGKDVAVSLAGYPSSRAGAVLTQPKVGSVSFWQDGKIASGIDPVRYNLWGNATAGYYAVEPWIGLQNALGSGTDVVRLRPSQSFTWSVDMTIDL